MKKESNLSSSISSLYVNFTRLKELSRLIGTLSHQSKREQISKKASFEFGSIQQNNATHPSGLKRKPSV